MEQHEGYLNATMGGKVFWRYWLTENAKATVVIVHGLGEHCSRYEHVAAACNSAGYCVAALDHPSHGKSDGTKGHIDRFSKFTDTLDEFVEQVKTDIGGPLMLLGHSMGGLVSCAYLLEHQNKFRCCALSGPALASDMRPGAVQLALVKVLSALFPKMGLLQLDANGVSRDPKVVAQYENDPLVHHGKGSVRLVKELFGAMDLVMDNAEQITLPILSMHGAADSMADAIGSKRLIEKVGSTDKTLKLYEGLYHEIFNEPEQDEVIAYMLAWFDRQLA